MIILKLNYDYDDADRACLTTVFSSFFKRSPLEGDDEKRRAAFAARFRDIFNSNIFYNEYAALYEVAVRCKVTVGEWSIIQGLLENNREIILGSAQVNTNTGVMGIENATEDEKFYAWCGAVKALHTSLCDAPCLSEKAFEDACNGFIDLYRKKYTQTVFNSVGVVLNAPEDCVDMRGARRKVYQPGYEGSQMLYQSEISRVQRIQGSQRSFLVDMEWFSDDTNPDMVAERERRQELLATTGIVPIDSVWHGMRRGSVINILGPAKGGKTTFANFLVHRLLREDRRVAVWAMEGSSLEWLSKQEAALIRTYGGSLGTAEILRGNTTEMPDKERAYLVRAKMELAKRGTLSFIEQTGYVEDFIEIIKGHHTTVNKFDCLVIDSPVNIQSKAGRQKVERLSEAFMLIKDFAEHGLPFPVLVIITSQIKQDAIKQARNSAHVEFDETIGGETAETIRTPDDVIALFSTEVQRAARRVGFYHIAARKSDRFKKFEARADVA